MLISDWCTIAIVVSYVIHLSHKMFLLLEKSGILTHNLMCLRAGIFPATQLSSRILQFWQESHFFTQLMGGKGQSVFSLLKRGKLHFSHLSTRKMQSMNTCNILSKIVSNSLLNNFLWSSLIEWKIFWLIIALIRIVILDEILSFVLRILLYL